MPGGGSDCLPVLILNKLLKTQGAQNYQNAGNAVPEYATSTRDLRRMDSRFSRLDKSLDFLVGNSEQ